MSSNLQGEPWFSDKPTPEPPFRGPTRIQANKGDIPDDWEDDDGEDEGQTESIAPTKSRIEPDMPAESQGREERIEPPNAPNSMASPIAKKRAPPASYSDSGPSLPSFEPTVRILKRSTNPTGVTAAPTTASPQKSLVEREREYQQARERIFASPSDSAVSSSDNICKDSGAQSIIQRQPRGPSSGDAVGFRRQTTQM